MADIIKTTTSSNIEMEKKQIQTPQLPKSGEAHLMTKLAQNLSESYQMVKKHQQRYNELSATAAAAATTTTATQELAQMGAPKRMKQRKNILKKDKENQLQQQSATDEDDGEGGAWQEVTNKLKRKKKLSASLTSVSDSVNQEKRTRIEGMQLNCRGKLLLSNESSLAAKAVKLHVRTLQQQQQPQQANLVTNVVTPLNPPVAGAATPPPRLKRKLQENVVTIQKLNALSEQLRLEINALKSSLTTERSAVRVLRAQNEAETRKYKNEVKKLQNIVELMKKNSSQAVPTNAKKPNELPFDNTTNYEIQRLTNELQTLKDAYKALEEKKVINNDADRRKAADIREMKDAYEIRLTQLSKSAKIEISRLLEELKSKERSIGQLKKDLQILQTRTQIKSKNEQNHKSRNATTSSSMATKQQTTTTKYKPKKNAKKNPINEEEKEKFKKIHLNDEEKNDLIHKTEKLQNQHEKDQNDDHDDENVEKNMTISLAQDANEMKNLTDLELFNNTKNLQNTVTINLVKPTVKAVNSNNCRIQSSKLKSLVNIFENETQKNSQNSMMMKNENIKRNFITTITQQQQKPVNCMVEIQEEQNQQEQAQQEQIQREFLSLPQELTARLIDTTKANTTNTTKTNTEEITTHENEINCNENDNSSNNNEEQQEHPLHEFRSKDHNSDSDSALSSAPPSISPQPPPADMQTNDIWQTIRSYTRDIEKLQKDVESLQKENERLRTELNVAKDQILENEKTAIEATTNNAKLRSFMDRIKFLEQQERELNSECNDLREQNELLEFRILELEDSSDKWSLPCQNATANNAVVSSSSASTSAAQSQNVWNFGAGSGSMHNSIALFESTTENISQQLNTMLEDLSLKEEHKQCVQQVLGLLEKQQNERNILMSQRSTSSSNNSSGPNSFNTNSSSDETSSSLEMVKSRISDYSSASSASSAASTASCSTQPLIFENLNNSLKSFKSPTATATNSRIVATVPPYNSTQPLHIAPQNTPNESPRKNRSINCATPTTSSSLSTSWQSNSLTESGVFVESDFYSDNACTQTDFEEEEEDGEGGQGGEKFEEEEEADIEAESEGATAPNGIELKKQKKQQQKQKQHKVPAKPISPTTTTAKAAVAQALLAQKQQQQQQQQQLSEQQKRLQYYQERLRLLENKLIVYESSGDSQLKHLANRLQREIQLEKEVNELRDRVEYLESENAQLEEEKCEFEEAENDTRLRLQRLEIELEILSQRNVELELSKEASSAKYKDCRSECLILRDDLEAIETQLRHLDEDKRKAKENLEFLHSLLPVFLAYNFAISGYDNDYGASGDGCFNHKTAVAVPSAAAELELEAYGMGNTCEGTSPEAPMYTTTGGFHRGGSGAFAATAALYPEGGGGTTMGSCCCRKLQDEVDCLKYQLRQLNERYNEAMESADTHWLELETEYKDREELARSKEQSLKQKISQLEDICRSDSYAANEKITQMEDTERELKCCLKRMQREHQNIIAEHQSITREYECCREENQRLCETIKHLNEALEEEKKRCKVLKNELCLLQKVQQDADKRSSAELKTLRAECSALRNEFQNSEITNCELREEVKTLEKQIEKLQAQCKCYENKLRELKDEVSTKDEYCQRLEKHLERSEGYNLAEELDGSPSKRLRREEVADLKSAAKGLCTALRNVKECSTTVPQLNNVARDVKRLADCLLGEVTCDSDAAAEILKQIEVQLNESLMNFHTKKMGSEFYCKVYCPVKRPDAPSIDLARKRVH